MRLPFWVSELMTTVGMGMIGMNRLRNVTPSHFRHFDVEREDVGFQFDHQVARAIGIGSLPDHLDFGILGQAHG